MTNALYRALWLAPNARAASLVRGHLLSSSLDACLEPGVMTFHDLTRLILADAKTRLRPLRPPAERDLLRSVVGKALRNDEIKFFADATRRNAFINLLADHIHELKRGNISPEAYSKIRLPQINEDHGRELALLYSEYEQQLTTHALSDEDSEHRAARDALAAGNPSSLQHLDLIVVDGFTDFTRTQHDILRLLAQRANQLLISLPADAPRESRSNVSVRVDLFAKTAATLAELRYHHPQLEIRELAPRPLPWPALDHVLQHIFRNPNQLPPPSTEAINSLERLQIVAAASTHDEIVQIARRIKQQLTASLKPFPSGRGQGEGELSLNVSPTRPSDIVVVFRSLADVAPRVREVFEQFGIPYSIESQLPLATAPIVKTLLSLLRLDQENWPFRRGVSVITNNMLTAFDGSTRQAADWLVRELQIPDGRDKLLGRVEQLAAIEMPLDQLSDHIARRVNAAKTALPLLQLLATSLDDLPNEATPTDWFTALAQLATQLGITSNDSSAHTADNAAWLAVKNHFATLERLDTWLDTPPRQLSRNDLLNTLVDIVSHESLPRTHDDVGRVCVVAAPSARTIHARHVYLAGMSEQAFPSPERPGRLATDADYRALARATRGLAHFAESSEQNVPVPFSPAATRAQDEMLLFYEVLSRAEESLTISYPALDDKAQDLPASPYVLEIQRTFGEACQSKLQPAAPQLSPVPQDAHVYSPIDWRIQAVARAIDRDPDRRLLAGIFSSAACGLALDAALRIIHARAHGESFGPSEGLLTSPAVAARLAERFGAKHFWSPSQWETYATCPYKFFLEDVLNLTPLGDLVLETDFSRRGSRLHHVLATFHRQWPSLRGTAEMTTEEEGAQFLDHLCRVIDERIAGSAEGGIEAALLELDRRQIHKWAERHFDHLTKYEGACSKRGVQMKPAHLEFRFGPARAGDSDSDPNSINTAFVLDINGEKIRVTGQIDRIDVGERDGQKVFSVIDYKSGKKSSLSRDEIESGERLQLPIYVEAAQALVFGGDATPLAAGYWSMTGGFDAKGALAVEVEGDPAERWKNVRGTVEERIGQFVQDIRQGAFQVESRDKNCTSYCDFRTICRIAQIRSLGKTAGTPSTTAPSACGLAIPPSPQPPAPNP